MRARLAFFIALLSAAATWWAWGAVEPRPVVQDEYSYVLQADIFARGRWTMPPPPVASSFQQPHVLTSPRVASKFPPGHALVLAIGAVMRMPWLPVLLLSALSGALVFILLEPLVGKWIAMLGWVAWLSDPINLRFRPGYYSEVTSGASWLLAWWCLREWRKSDERKWLLGVAAALGLNAITRPLSAAALAIPVGAFVVWRTIQKSSWRDLGSALLVGSLCVAVLPLWSVETTGRLSPSPVALYRAQYLPFDKLGFGLDPTPPQLSLTPLNSDVYAEFAPEHAKHNLAALPRIAVDRLAVLAREEWSGARVLLIPLVVIGLIAGGAEAWFTAICAASLFAAYLLYAHWPGWTVYYFEALPTTALLAAVGLSRLRERAQALRWSRGMVTHGATVAVAVALCAILPLNLETWRHKHIEDARYDTAFYRMIEKLPFRGAVVFVRYAENAHPHTTVVTNSATLGEDRTWVVVDDPKQNAAVMQAANGRTPLLFEERGSSLRVYRELLGEIVTAQSAR